MGHYVGSEIIVSAVDCTLLEDGSGRVCVNALSWNLPYDT